MEKLNFVDVLIDEIALEGLDGITLPSLWIRLECREESQVVVDEGRKTHLWLAVATHCDIDFFRLPESRPDVEKFNRFECFNEDKSCFLHPENLAAEAYGFKGVDQDGLIGSCPTYVTRENVNSQIRDTNYKCLISLQAALEKWDRSLVMVAKQHRRTFALTQNYLIPNGLENPTFYLVLEAIGRARKCGLASGRLLPQLSCRMFGFDPKFCFYVTKCLITLNLIKKQSFPVAYRGKKVGLNVFHLNRFYQRHLGGIEFIKQSLFQYLREQPAQVQELNIVKDIFKLHNSISFKKFMHQSKGLLSIHRIPYKSFYPDASTDECIIHSNGNERFIKVIVLEKDLEDNNESEEEADERLMPTTRLWNDNYDWQGNKGILNQVFEYLYNTGAKGSTLKQMAHNLGVNSLLVRQTIKPLFHMKFIKKVMRNEGRQKYTVYITSHFENSGFSSYDKAWEEFQKKTTVTGAGVDESSLSLASRRPRDSQNVDKPGQPIKKLRLNYIDRRHSGILSAADFSKDKSPVDAAVPIKPIQESASISRVVAEAQSLLETPSPHQAEEGKISYRKIIKPATGSVIITRKKYRRPAIVPTKKKRAAVLLSTRATNGAEGTGMAVSKLTSDSPRQEHDSTCSLQAPDGAGDDTGAGGQTRFLSVLGLAEAESGKQSASSRHQAAGSTAACPQHQAATSTAACPQHQAVASTAACPQHQVAGDSQAMVKVTFEANTPWQKWIANPLVSEKMTENLIKIANMMVDLVRKHRVLDSLIQFRQEIRQRLGKYDVCRKTIRRLIQWCEKHKKVTTYYITFECSQKSMQLLLVCAKDVSRDDPLVVNVMEQFKLKHFGLMKKGHRKQVGVKTVITDWAQLVRLAIKLDKNTNSGEVRPKNQINTRYKKWEKAHLFHRYLWYMVCGYQGTAPETTKSSTSVDVNIDDCFEGESPEPPVYLDVQDWRRYLPPLCRHPEAASNCGRPENVALVGNLLLCMPLSLFVILINGQSLSCVKEYMGDSVRHNHPLSALPLGVLGALLHLHKYMDKIGYLLRYLCSLGLVAVGLMPYSDRSKQFVYVRKTALLLDTTGSMAGYCQTVLPPGLDAFPEVRFKFEELSDVEHYWHELRRFASFTNLNNKSKMEPLVQRDNKGDLALLEEQCKYKPLDKVPEEYFLPGNRRGAGGTDSNLFLHLKRNWVEVPMKSDQWHITRNRVKAIATQKRKEKIAISALARARTVENRKLKLAQRCLQALHAPGAINQEEIHPKLQKTTLWNAALSGRTHFRRIKKKVVHQPGSGEKKRRKPEYNFDEKDRAASKLKTSDRARFTVREISAVLMGKVAMYFFMGDRGTLETLSPIRDVMHERLSESTNKTRRMLQTCIMRQMKQSAVRRSFAHCLIRIRQDKELLDKYQQAVVPLGTPPNAEKINPFIRGLFIDLLEKYLGGELEGVFQLPETLQALQGSYERVQGEKAVKEYKEWADVASDRDACTTVVRDFQMSHLLSEWDKQGRDYELYNTLRQYPDDMIGEVFHTLKLNQVIARRKKTKKDCDERGDLRSYLLHSRMLGVFRRSTYPVDLFTTAYGSLCKVEEAHANGTALTLPLGSACPGDLGMVVGLMAMDKIQMSIDVGQNVIEIKQLQDIFKKQDRIQQNRVSLSAKRSHAQMGEFSDDSDEEKAGSTICGNLNEERKETENEFAPLTKRPRVEGDKPLVLAIGATHRAVPPKHKGAKRCSRHLSGSEVDSTDDDGDGDEEWQPPRKKKPRRSKGPVTLNVGGGNKGLSSQETETRNAAKSSEDTMSDFFLSLHLSVDDLLGALDQVRHGITVKKNCGDDSVQVSTVRTTLNLSSGDVGLRLVKPNRQAVKSSFSSLTLQRMLPQESACLNLPGQIPITIVMSNISLGLKDPGDGDGPAGKSAPCVPSAVPDCAAAAVSMDQELSEAVPSFAAHDKKVDSEQSVVNGEEIVSSEIEEVDSGSSAAKETNTVVFARSVPSSETTPKTLLTKLVLCPTSTASSTLPSAAEQDTASQTSRTTTNCQRTGREISTRRQNGPQWLQSFIADQAMAPIAPEVLKAIIRKQTKLLPFDAEIPERWEQLREEIGGQAAARCLEVYKAIETGKAIGLTWPQLKAAVHIDEELLYCTLETLMDYDLVLRVGVIVFRFVCLAKARCWVVHTLKNNRGRGSSVITNLEDAIHLEDREEASKPEDSNPGGKVNGTDLLKETEADISQTLAPSVSCSASAKGDDSTPGNRKIDLSLPPLPESGETTAALSPVMILMEEKIGEATSEEACLELVSKSTPPPIGGTVNGAAVSENAPENERQTAVGSENINDGINTENVNQTLDHDPGLVGSEAVPSTSATPEHGQQTQGLDRGSVCSKSMPSTLAIPEAPKGSLGGEQTGKQVRAGRRIAARKWLEKTNQEGDQKEEDNKLKELHVSSYKKIRLQSRIWKRPEGGLNSRVLPDILDSMMYHIMRYPGSTLLSLTHQYSDLCTPVDLHELLKMLEELGCVRLMVMKKAPSFLFTTSTDISISYRHTDCLGASPSELTVEPAADCIHRLGQFLHFIKK